MDTPGRRAKEKAARHDRATPGGAAADGMTAPGRARTLPGVTGLRFRVTERWKGGNSLKKYTGNIGQRRKSNCAKLKKRPNLAQLIALQWIAAQAISKYFSTAILQSIDR